MESRHSELLLVHRAKFVENVDVEKLISFFKAREILNSHDVEEIRNQSNPSAKTEKFLDILPSKGVNAFATLCLSLESTYPNLLTLMFLSTCSNHKNSDLMSKDSERNEEVSSSADCSSSIYVSPSCSSKCERHNNPTVLKAELKLVTHDRDTLQKELHKVHAERDFLMQDVAMSSSDPLTRLGTLTKQHAASNSDKSLTACRDYDWLKSQCEQAMGELQSLRRQHTDTVRRCDVAMRDSELYRGKHRQAINKIDKQQHESQSLRQQFKETLAEKRRLEEEVMNLRGKEMDEAERHRQKTKNDNSRNEAINQMYNTLLNKYDDLQAEFDNLHKRYTDLLASRSSSSANINSDELAEIRKRYEIALEERNNLTRERNGLSQQCTAAIHKWDTTLRELTIVKESLAKVQQQRDEAMKEINQAMAVRIKATKDLARLTEERNAAVQEYSLVMLERDSVHKEIEKLQEELNESNRRAEGCMKDKKGTLEEVETLRREISSALHDRDRALKECNDLREKYSDYVTGRQEGGEELRGRRDYDTYSRRDSNRKLRSESFGRQDALTGSGDTPSKHSKDKLDNLDQANQELDRLRKQLEKLNVELMEAQQEAEVCKRRRDWAFNERDKIVLERESIRTLCDKLRRERDRAVSDLAEALRDSDDIKKQRNEASKELKELREKMEVQMVKESRAKQLNNISHNHSHDSAIDADLQEWEMETITIDLGGGIDVDQVGFDLGGGKDDPQYPDSSIFITAINKGSIADGKLKINDTVLQINNVDLTNSPSSKALEAIRNGDGFVTVVVRRRHSSRFVQAVQLQLSDEKDHGLSLETGLFISRIAPGSVAAREGGLAIGDRIIHMNGKTMDGLIPANEAMQMLSNANEPVVVAVAKCYTNSISSGNNTEDSMDSPSNKESASRPKEMSKKLITSSCQTDDVETSPKKSTASTQSKFFDRAYQKFFRERRTGKDRSEKKSSQNNSSPSPVHEEEAIAHLDSVIEHFKKNVKPNKARKRKEKEKNNGGTWPRYRANPPIANVEQCVGTVFNPTKRKERISIASLMNNSTKNYHSPIYDNKISDDKSASVSSSYSTLNRTTQSKCKLAADLKDSDQFLSSPKQSPFHPPSSSSLLSKSMTDSKGTMVSSGSVHYSTASSLDSHLDYSVVSANKNVLEYYHRNKVKVRPKSSHYPQGDSESLSAAESPLPPKPSSHDLPSLYSKHPPLHMSSGSMSSTHGGLLSPKTAFSDSPHLSERSQPFVRSPPNSLAYFPVSSGRIPHTHPSHPHPHSPTSSSVKYSSRSGDTLMSSVIPETIPMVRHYHRSDGRYSLTPTSSSSPHSFSHSPSQSLELHHYHQLSAKHLVPKHTHAGYRDELGGYGSYDGPSTFPKRVHQRSRLPSNQSVTSKSSASKVSTSSIERVADEMLPSLHVVTDMQVSNTTASSMPDFRNKKLASGALRSIFIDKSAQPLGIQIDCGAHGGIFVSSVSENSLAAQAGLQIGDQLLEVCGINMRSATYLLAANVLRQCGDSITMLVQYSPDKYKEALETTASCSSSSSSSSRSSDGSPAPTPTPSSSPKTPKNIVIGLDVSDSVPPSANSTLTRQSKPTNKTISDEQNLGLQEPRRVFLKKCTSNLGVSLLGGNAVGIFVHSVQPDSPASGPNGLRCGDQILEYNGIDLRSATAEQAASELAKPAEVISMLAQYNYTRYLEIQEQAGDSFYIRTMFDRVAESPEELSFRKDDILYVDNTMLNGVSGMWRAWLVNDDGQKRKWGLIPSKYKVDEELLLKRSLGELDSDSGSRRGNTSARRSFFRRKKHQRSNSRDSKELASYSDVSINTYGDAGASIGDTTSVSYLRVERLDYLVLRPVLILGPLIEAVVHKLVLDFPLKFQRCLPESIHGSPHTVEKGLEENVFVDYRRRGSHYECITAAAIKEICDNNTHCIIDLSPQSVERLHRQRIYPIVLFIKFKSTKQIREVKDSTFLTEKVSTKAAKEMYEHSLKIENEYKPLISAVIPGGSLAYMCAQIKEVVDQEQSKTLWVRAAGTV